MNYTRKLAPLAIAALTVALAVPAAAGRDAVCKATPQAQWRTVDDVRSAAQALGYQVARVKTEANCYEVYARTKEGRKVEVFFDPATLEVVAVKDKS